MIGPRSEPGFSTRSREHLTILDSLERGDAEGAVANLELHFRASAYRTVVAA